MGCIVLLRCELVLRCDLAGVVWYPYAGFSLHTDTTPTQPNHTLKQCFSLHTDTTPPQPNQHQHTSNQNNTTHEITQQISRKLLRMDVLTSETCWALNNEIKKQVTSSWSLFIQLEGKWFLILFGVMTSFATLDTSSTSSQCVRPLADPYRPHSSSNRFAGLPRLPWSMRYVIFWKWQKLLSSDSIMRWIQLS